MNHMPKTQGNSHADRVRNLLPLMPAEFTIKDLLQHDESISQPAASAALRWSVQHGLLKVVRQIAYTEWRGQGHRGAPPILYTFLGYEGYSDKRRRKSKSAALAPRKQSLPAPASQSLPAQVNEALAAVIEEPAHQCDATQVIENVQRSLATINLLIAMQKLSPEQAMTLAGTLNSLGDQTKRR